MTSSNSGQASSTPKPYSSLRLDLSASDTARNRRRSRAIRIRLDDEPDDDAGYWSNAFAEVHQVIQDPTEAMLSSKTALLLVQRHETKLEFTSTARGTYHGVYSLHLLTRIKQRQPSWECALAAAVRCERLHCYDKS